MDVTTLRIVATLLSFATFIGIWIWAFLRRNADRFEEAAQLPFADEQPLSPHQPPGAAKTPARPNLASQ